MASKVLMVAEKPSLARSLAEILSRKKCRRRKSICNACDVYEFEGVFPAEGQLAAFKMTSVCGHVMSLDFLPKFNRWDQVDPVELFQAETEKKEAIPKLRICDFLRNEGRGVDYLVLWLDCDKEGENICFEVIEEVEPLMRKPRVRDKQTVYRARFSSITESAIVQAFASLTAPNWNEARSVDARMELDLRIGCSFTRFQTKTFQTKYAGLNNSVISYGPCQTPTLGFCVQRHDEIQQFKPEKFWKLDAKVKLDHAIIGLEWDREGLFDSEVAHLFYALIKDSKQGKVTAVTAKQKTKAPPPALHTVELLRIASSKLHIGPKQAMDVAERLYIEGYISYPRTETTRYPKDFDFKQILQGLQWHPEFGEYVKSLLQNGYKVRSSGADAGDHPPITPMCSATRDSLRDTEWKVYDFITRHFLATLFPDCKYKSTEVKFLIGSEEFTWSGSTSDSPGYTQVYTWHAIQGDESPKLFETNQVWDVHQLKLSEHLTSPPAYLTESELISLMEKHCIGTDASISVHIENISNRNYVRVESGRRLVPTKLGIVLVHGYQKIDPELVLPTMRSAVEEQLSLIAKGKADYDKVLEHTIYIFKQKFEYFKNNVEEMDELFEASFSSVADTGRLFSKCGLCRRYMKYISSRPQRLYCMNCDQTYSLPQIGNIKLYKELKCPLDDFEILLFTARNGKKSYLLCPYCYNEPPFKNLHKGMSCSLCPHETCVYSKAHHRVNKCTECEKGVLVLEPHWQTGGPQPQWRISCNNTVCQKVFTGFAGSQSVTATPELCHKCGANFISVDLAEVSGVQPEVTLDENYVGCWHCDPLLSSLISDQVQGTYHHHRGRGGRRGRGRGRGRSKNAKGHH